MVGSSPPSGTKQKLSPLIGAFSWVKKMLLNFYKALGLFFIFALASLTIPVLFSQPDNWALGLAVVLLALLPAVVVWYVKFMFFRKPKVPEAKESVQ